MNIALEVIEGDVAAEPFRIRKEYANLLKNQRKIHCSRCPFHGLQKPGYNENVDSGTYKRIKRGKKVKVPRLSIRYASEEE